MYEYDAPLDLSFLYIIRDHLRTRSELFYAPRHPQDSPEVDLKRSVLEQITEKDILLHYPYQSIRPFLQMLSEAAVSYTHLDVYKRQHQDGCLKWVVTPPCGTDKNVP